MGTEEEADEVVENEKVEVDEQRPSAGADNEVGDSDADKVE